MRPDGSREALNGVLDDAEAKLKCTHVVVVSFFAMSPIKGQSEPYNGISQGIQTSQSANPNSYIIPRKYRLFLFEINFPFIFISMNSNTMILLLA